MKVVTLPRLHDERPFDYYCSRCGLELAESNYESIDAVYTCPGCGTRERASRIPARRR
jgi:DNA-directed RNA polymerase subunit RPC12/RpoP